MKLNQDMDSEKVRLYEAVVYVGRRSGYGFDDDGDDSVCCGA